MTKYLPSHHLSFLTGLLYQKLDEWSQVNPNDKPFVIIKIVKWNDEIKCKTWDKDEKIKGKTNYSEIKDYDDFKLKTKKVKYTKRTYVKKNRSDKIESIKEEVVSFEPILKQEVHGHIELIQDYKVSNFIQINYEKDHYSVECKKVLKEIEQEKEKCETQMISYYSESPILVNGRVEDMLPKYELDDPFSLPLSSGSFGSTELIAGLKIVKKAKDIRTEINGVQTSLTVDSALKPLGWVDSSTLVYPFQKLCSKDQFIKNLKDDVNKIHRLGICHMDLHPGNISFSGKIIDNGLIKKVGEQIKTVHNFVRKHMVCDLASFDVDDRCLEELIQIGIFEIKEKEFENLWIKFRNIYNQTKWVILFRQIILFIALIAIIGEGLLLLFLGSDYLMTSLGIFLVIPLYVGVGITKSAHQLTIISEVFQGTEFQIPVFHMICSQSCYFDINKCLSRIR